MGTFQYGGILEQVASTATAGSTTTLTNISKQIQVFTGTANQTIVLPNATTYNEIGAKFEFFNESTGTLTIEANGGSILATITGGNHLTFKLINNSASAGIWVESYSSYGAASAPKNYLSVYTPSTSSGIANTGNGNFELGSTTGWSLGTIGTLTNGLPIGSPTFGSGASGNLNISVISSGQLSGLYSLSYASSAATTQGNMLASNAFYIDKEDQAKVLTYKLYYSVPTNPSNGNFSGTSSNSFGVAAYDVTNSVWLPVTGAFGMTQNSGVGYATGTFQTGISTNQICFIIYNINATSGAITLYFDDISVGPQTAPFGPAMNDWITFTPTGSWTTNATYNGRWRRVGDSMEVQSQVTLSGANTQGALSFNLPSGYSVDTTKLPNNGGTQYVVDGETVSQQSTQASVSGVLYSTSTSVIALTDLSSGTYANTVQVNSATNVPYTFASGNSVEVCFVVPIVGWSSNVQMSSDTDTRVVAFSAYKTASQTGINTNNSALKFVFDTVVNDSAGAYSTANNRYIAPVTGWYYFQAGIRFNPTNVLNDNYYLQFWKNGSAISNYVYLPPAGAVFGLYGTLTVYMNAGDYLEAYVLGTGNNSSNTISTAGTSTDQFFSGYRLSGPSVIAATESVNMRYGNNSAQSITTASSTTITNWTKAYDTHNVMNATSGVYTFPVSGKYLVIGNLSWTANATGSRYTLAIVTGNDAGTYTLGGEPDAGAATDAGQSSGSLIVNANAGDTVALQGFQRSGGNLALTGGVDNNFFCVARLGN